MATAFAVIAPSCIISKITPSKVECMVFGTGMSIIIAAKEFGSSIMGVVWNHFWLKISKKNYHGLDGALLIIIIARTLSLTFLYLLPTNAEVERVQDKLCSMCTDKPCDCLANQDQLSNRTIQQN